MTNPPSILVTGANRGLGLEFVRQYAADNWRVFACCRNPARASELASLSDSHPSISVHRLDVAHHEQIDELAEKLRDESIDILMNNAGIYGPGRMFFGQIDYDAWREVLEVNTLAPLKMSEAFLDQVLRSERKIIASVSSEMGSLAHNAGGRHYLYRSSKAALNMVTKSMSVDLRERGVTAVVFCPGWVRTDMGGSEATLSPEESIQGMKQVLDSLDISRSGQFINYDGSELPW